MTRSADRASASPPGTSVAPLLSALEHGAESFALFDAEDRLVYANARTADFFPELADRLSPGRPFEELLRCYADRHPSAPPPGPEREEWVRRGLLRHRTATERFILRTPAGRWLLASERPLPDGGVASIHTDVTALKEAERRLRDSEAEARAARNAAERSNRAKVEFLAHMSHELRTPLNAVLGFTEIMLSEALGPLGHHRYRDYARDIHDSGTHLLALIDDLLDLTRIEAGRATLREEAVDPLAIIAEALAAAGWAAAAAPPVELDTAAPVPLLLADRAAMLRMVENLIDNALKFTPATGRVTVSTTRLPDGGVGIMVADTGVGIDPALLPLVQEPFGRADGFRAAAGRGTGLGLPLVKRLVELHGGRLALESDPGTGTTAILLFPPARSLERLSWPLVLPHLAL